MSLIVQKIQYILLKNRRKPKFSDVVKNHTIGQTRTKIRFLTPSCRSLSVSKQSLIYIFHSASQSSPSWGPHSLLPVYLNLISQFFTTSTFLFTVFRNIKGKKSFCTSKQYSNSYIVSKTLPCIYLHESILSTPCFIFPFQRLLPSQFSIFINFS